MNGVFALCRFFGTACSFEAWCPKPLAPWARGYGKEANPPRLPQGDGSRKGSVYSELPLGGVVRSFTDYLWFQTRERREFINITDRVKEVVAKSHIAEGLCLVSAMHITATVYVNDDEEGLLHDIQRWADQLAPPGDYEHHRTGEGNGDAHLKNLLIGHQVVLPVTHGSLDLGPWEQVFYGEFDGQRRKRVVVKVIGE